MGREKRGGRETYGGDDPVVVDVGASVGLSDEDVEGGGDAGAGEVVAEAVRNMELLVSDRLIVWEKQWEGVNILQSSHILGFWHLDV